MKTKLNKSILGLLAGLSLFAGLTLNAQSNDSKREFYSVFFIDVKNQALYQEYRNKTKDILLKAGGVISRELEVIEKPQGPLKVGMPNRVVFMHFDTKDGIEKLKNDATYIKYKDIRNKAINTVQVLSGANIFSETSHTTLKERLYILKLSRYLGGNVNRLNILEEVDASLDKYGFKTDKKIAVKSSVGIEKIDEIALHFYDDPKQQDMLRKDKKAISNIMTYNKNFVDTFVYLTLKVI